MHSLVRDQTTLIGVTGKRRGSISKICAGHALSGHTRHSLTLIQLRMLTPLDLRCNKQIVLKIRLHNCFTFEIHCTKRFDDKTDTCRLVNLRALTFADGISKCSEAMRARKLVGNCFIMRIQ